MAVMVKKRPFKKKLGFREKPKALLVESNGSSQLIQKPYFQKPSFELRRMLQRNRMHGLRGISWAFKGKLIFVDRKAFKSIPVLEQSRILQAAKNEGFEIYFST